MMVDLENWMIENYIDFKFIEDMVFEINGIGKFFTFDIGEKPLFDDEFSLNLSEANTDLSELIDEGIQYSAFKFGDIWYYSSNESETCELKPLQSLGRAFLDLEEQYSNLGIHGHRELLNGSNDYDSYVSQAGFFGYKSIGICERNTLAGCLLFQNACKKGGVKPILGISVDVVDYDGLAKEAKLYVEDSCGWDNAMSIANIINNRDHEKSSISIEELCTYALGLTFVFSKNWVREENFSIDKYSSFENIYFQLDTTEYSADTIDKSYLEHTKDWIRYTDFGEIIVEPILISDTYYVHQSDYVVKKTLNQIDIGASHLQSEEQFFKPLEYHFDKLDPMVSDDDFDKFEKMFNQATRNTMDVAINCDFEINTDFLNMPEYELTEEEYKKYKDKYELFDAIVDSNWSDRVPEGMDDVYEDRLEEEFRVIDGNGFLDYFLINWDWLQFCKRENIYTGIARGSAGGSVLSYLLGVTNIDPIKYGLLFERFLNEGRLKKTVKTRYLKFHNSEGQWIQFKEDKLIKLEDKYVFANEITVGDNVSSIVVDSIEEWFDETVTAGSPPDIDSDVESIGRQRVKEYLEERYGKHRVFSIGTFTSLGIKSALSDVARVKGVDTKIVKTLTKMITQKEVLSGFGFPEFIKKALSNKVVRKFIEDFPEVVEITRVVLNNSKSQSVHAAGVVISPRFKNGEEASAWNWTPTKLFDGQLVSEWEGEYLEQSGMLKLDLLGLNTLDKIHYVVDSIEKESGEKLDWHDIYINRTDDKPTFDIFSSGLTQNVFQFSGEDMTKFVKSMKPTTVEDIFAANALFRPATMNLGYHEDYVEMKHGRKEVEYDWGLEEITSKTFSIMAYQEQMMQAVQRIGGFSLQEADAVRKAMGKKKKGLMDSYRARFLEGAVKNGCEEFEAIKIWNDIEQGAGYGFNRSHAAAYGLESYVTAYLKAHYPVHFYTMSLAFSNDDTRPLILSEIDDDGRISIVPPHINQSGFDFETDFKENKIYWAIKSIKFVGDVAVRSIIDIRESDGDYTSLENFVQRTSGKKINKTHVVNLILSGAFDEIEGLKSSVGRFGLIQWYFSTHLGEVVPKDKFPSESALNTFFWNKLQLELSGIGYIDYKKIYSASGFKESVKRSPFLATDKVSDAKVGKFVTVAGAISDIKELTIKKSGDKFAKITLQSNSHSVNVLIWTEKWVEHGRDIMKSKGSICVLNGIIAEDNYSGANQITVHKKTKIKFM